MDNRPIGVFDSSVGGISVLRELMQIMPNESYHYLGDTHNAPYGVRSEPDIRDLTRRAAAELLNHDIKALLIACNTATSAAAAALRSELSIPVVGMEPALKPAALACRAGGRIAVLATPATLRQRKFQVLFERYGEHAKTIPCAGLMEYVERFELDSPGLHEYLTQKLDPEGGEPYAAVVLGCTHYVFLRSALQKAVPGAQLFDGNRGTALRMKSVLEAREARSSATSGTVVLDTTGDRDKIVPVMKRLLSLD